MSIKVTLDDTTTLGFLILDVDSRIIATERFGENDGVWPGKRVLPDSLIVGHSPIIEETEGIGGFLKKHLIGSRNAAIASLITEIDYDYQPHIDQVDLLDHDVSNEVGGCPNIS